MRLRSLIALALSLAATNIVAADPDPLVGFDAAVAKAMKAN